MSRDTTHSIMKSAKRFFGGTLFSRISGMLRDIVMASAFGTQEAIAAFLVAFRFAHLLRRLFGEGALQTAFIPHFETLRTTSPRKASEFFRDLFGLLTLGLTALIFLSIIVLGICLYWIPLSTGNREILFLSLLLMPSLLFICLFGLNASLLQCEKSYFTAGVAPVAFNLIWVVGVICLWNISPPEAMPWLAGWVIIACLGQWLMTFPRALSILKQNGLDKIWSNFNPLSPDVKQLGKPLLLGILGVAAAQLNNACDAVFARYASGEGPAYLWYALRLQQLPVALFGIAIAGALLPPLTRALKNKDLSTFHEFFEFALRRSVALMLPITIAIFVMGDSAIQLIYGRGDFTIHSTIGTTQCLWGYGAGLLPMTLVLILAPAFYAQNNYRTPAIASCVAMGLNIALNGWWILGIGYGTASVAWATSVSAMVNLLWLAFLLPNGSVLQLRSLWGSASKVLLSSIVAAVAVVFVESFWLGGSSALLIMKGEIPFYSDHFADLLMHLLMQCGVFVGALSGMAWVLEASDLLRLARAPK